MPEELDYFNYLKRRSIFRIMLRKLIYLRPIVKEFEGKTLDIGCGIGEVLSMYKDSVGIDINPHCVNYCKEQGFNASVGDIYEIPYNNDTLNTVLCSNVLEHLDNPDKAMSELRRVLVKGGKLIITVPMKRAFKNDRTHKMFWDDKELVQLFEKHGFMISKKFFIPINGKIADSLPLMNGELTVVGVKN